MTVHRDLRFLRSAAAAALAALPEQQRIATVLAHRHGLSCAAIAEVLAVSGDDARLLLHEAMHTIDESISRARVRWEAN